MTAPGDDTTDDAGIEPVDADLAEPALAELAAATAEIDRLRRRLAEVGAMADDAADGLARAQATIGYRLQRAHRKARARGLAGYLPAFAAALRWRPRRRTTPTVPAQPGSYAAARIIEQNRLGRHRPAAALAAAAPIDPTAEPELLEQARIAYSKAGQLNRAADALDAQRKVKDSAKRRRQLAVLQGRLTETTPGWLPRVTGSPDLDTPPPAGRVLHLLKASTPFRESGYTLRSRYVLAGQRANGLHPVAMTALGFPRSIDPERFAAGETVPGTDVVDEVEHHRLDLGADYDDGGRSDAYLSDYADLAARQVRRIVPEIIHVHSGHRGYDAALVGLALGRHFGLPVVYEVRGFFEATWTAADDDAELGEHYRRRVATENRAMRAADAVVTLSESMRADIIGRGVRESSVFVVPNAVDSERFTPRERPSALVERYRLEGRFVFGYISNLDHPREGHEYLIDAALALRDQGIAATALIVGDGHRRAELEQRVADAGAADIVRFTGRVEHSEILDHYALLDAFVVPRIRERAASLVTPLKPYEAMAAGVPLLVADLPALAEVTGHGSRGRTFEPENALAMATELADMARDPEPGRALATEARRWVAEERNWTRVAARYLDVYRAIRGA